MIALYADSMQVVCIVARCADECCMMWCKHLVISPFNSVVTHGYEALWLVHSYHNIHFSLLLFDCIGRNILKVLALLRVCALNKDA
jgi:hypothetical protein